MFMSLGSRCKSQQSIHFSSTLFFSFYLSVKQTTEFAFTVHHTTILACIYSFYNYFFNDTQRMLERRPFYYSVGVKYW